jgi:hypothetical protein
LLEETILLFDELSLLTLDYQRKDANKEKDCADRNTCVQSLENFSMK